MKTQFYCLLLMTFGFFAGSKVQAQVNVKLTTSAVAADTIYQGTNTNLVYAVKMDVTNAATTVNNIQYVLSGSFDADDLSYTSVYFNATAPTISGASYLGQTVATFAAPANYSININRPMAAGTSGYFLITVNVNTAATDEHTVRITGSTNPVTFGYTTAVSLTNNQNNGGGLQTIQAPDIALSTSSVAADTIYQGTNTNIVSITKMKVTTANVNVTNIQYTLSGNHDADDLTYTSVYYNTTPDLTGASYLGQTTAPYAAPHLYSINIYKPMPAGTTGYFIVTVNVNTSATDNHTVKVSAATNPVVFSYNIAPNVTNSQTNGGGTQTIMAPDITLSSSTVAAGNIARSSSSNIVYALKADVTVANVNITNIQYTLSGSHDADDLSYTSVYFNPTSPVIAGASYLGQVPAGFAGPHSYSINIYKPMAAGTSGYFLITVNVNAAATIGNTVRLTGATTPVIFSYNIAPNVTNNQSNAAGLKTISATLLSASTSENNNSTAITAGDGGNSSDNATVATAQAIQRIYPNPVSDRLNVEFTSAARQNVVLVLKDGNGRVAATRQYGVEKGACRLDLNVSNVPAGMYYLSIRSGTAILTADGKVMVNH